MINTKLARTVYVVKDCTGWTANINREWPRKGGERKQRDHQIKIEGEIAARLLTVFDAEAVGRKSQNARFIDTLWWAGHIANASCKLLNGLIQFITSIFLRSIACLASVTTAKRKNTNIRIKYAREFQWNFELLLAIKVVLNTNLRCCSFHLTMREIGGFLASLAYVHTVKYL